MDLDPICGEITYGLERIAAFLQDVDSIYDIVWARDPETGARSPMARCGCRKRAVFGLQLRLCGCGEAVGALRLYEAECLALLYAGALRMRRRAKSVERCRCWGHTNWPEVLASLQPAGCARRDQRDGAGRHDGRIRNLAVGVARAYAATLSYANCRAGCLRLAKGPRRRKTNGGVSV